MLSVLEIRSCRDTILHNHAFPCLACLFSTLLELRSAPSSAWLPRACGQHLHACQAGRPRPARPFLQQQQLRKPRREQRRRNQQQELRKPRLEHRRRNRRKPRREHRRRNRPRAFRQHLHACQAHLHACQAHTHTHTYTRTHSHIYTHTNTRTHTFLHACKCCLHALGKPTARGRFQLHGSCSYCCDPTGLQTLTSAASTVQTCCSP